MTAERTGMQENVLAGLIEQGVPLTVLAPHLDDAVLSCGALITHAASRTAVTVTTFFTEGGQGPYTMSARRYLHQVGERHAKALYQQRRAEDRAALEPLDITCVHAGLTEALFRRRPVSRSRSGLGRMLPELAHAYPSYRKHVTSGRIAAADAGTLRAARAIVQRVAESGPHLVLAPLGVGGHVDHVLVHTAAQSSGIPVVYYSDFPYNQRDSARDAFIHRTGLVETQWPVTEAKVELIRAYRTQLWSLFRGADIPLAPEVFFVDSRTQRDGIGGLAEVRNK
ncbi:MAG TPA: PIG-L family deacetylase [Streptosporangiaceae bacterium]|jgi:LmbE family N-acetylglucosaminyl deacetylase|nr:PIG-L family deacetylase [Streptosporangiaceae bacterium]